MADFDIAVIGSGIGGLTAAAFLARAGKKVLVLEKHTKIGGYAHHFKRRDFTFESGIHSVPMGDKGFVRHLLKLLDVNEMVETIPFSEMFSVRTPDFHLAMPGDLADMPKFMKDVAPEDSAGIDRMFSDARKLYDAIAGPQFKYEGGYIPEDANLVSQFHNSNYAGYLDSVLTNKNLKGLLGGQWPFGGTPPERGGHLFYFMMFSFHAIEGSHFCKGGFATLADALAESIKRNGGEIRTRSEVTSISGSNKRAEVIRLKDGTEITAKTIVSNVSPYLLHRELLSDDLRGRFMLRRLGNLHPSVSSMIVYLGMKRGFEKVHPKSIVFEYDHTDYTKMFDEIVAGRRFGMDHLISLRSLHDPTLTLMNFASASASNSWKEDKKIWADAMLDKAEKLYPGLRGYVEAVEIGSPATFDRYTYNTDGSLYGFENASSMYGEAKMPHTTHLPNLFQVGHWGRPGCGVWNVMSNAYTGVQIMLGRE